MDRAVVCRTSCRRWNAFGSVVLSLTLLLNRISSSYSADGLAATPPRGWNSYDSFSWIVSEDEFLENAQLVATNLKPFGYEYVVVDFLWYRKRDPKASIWSPGFDIIDEWGRLVPDPERWPSTAGGKGFRPIADKIHAMGLKFGLHVMRGISTAAVNKNTPILGAKGGLDGSRGAWRAQDIALHNRPCRWMPECFVSVNSSSEGGKAFIESLYQQYASWNVDFIKHDCVFGADDLSLDEVETVSQAIANTGRPIIYSLSPGVRATTAMGMSVNKLSHMYRVTGDDWDTWKDVLSHFDVARDFAAAGLIGALGLQNGRSWPDLDMLPLGFLTDPGAPYGPYRWCRLSYDEQKLQMTLWAISKSPLMYGGDLRHIDKVTTDLITNSVMLDINSNSYGNHEVYFGPGTDNDAPPIPRFVDCSEATDTRWGIYFGRSNKSQLCWTMPTISLDTGKRARKLSGCFEQPSYKATCEAFLTSSKEVNVQNLMPVSAPFLTSEIITSCMDSWKQWPMALGTSEIEQLVSTSKITGQIWQVTPQGQLRNSRLGLCASMQEQVNLTRVWAARGPSGALYVAFFNLGLKPSSITISLDSLVKDHALNSSFRLPENTIFKYGVQCVGSDVWSHEKLGIVGGVLTASVAPHGAALFSLTCNFTISDI